jgi:hypothetical protein
MSHYSARFFFMAAIIGAGILNTFEARAQADFRTGYIVQATGDTVRGQIDYRGARRGAQQCLFRAAGARDAVPFQPDQLRGYGLASGEYYISQFIPAVANQSSTAQPTATGTAPAPQALFLEVLVAGEAYLLAQHDQAGSTHYYILKKGAALPTELVQERRQVMQDGRLRNELLLPVFRGVLTTQFADCPAVLLRVSKTEYKESALIAVVEQYNACRQPGQLIAAHQRPTEANLELLLGGQLSQTTYNENEHSDNLSGAIAPEFGLALRVGRRTAKQKISFRLELHYARQVATGTFERQTALPGLGQYLTTTYETRFKAAYLRMPVLVRYTLPGTKLHPFIEVGASLNYAIQLDPQLRRINDSKGAGATDWYTLFSNTGILMRDPFRRYEVGFLAGAGVQLASIAGHPVAVLARVERSDGFMLAADYSTPVVRGSLLLSFDLTKAKAE